MPLRFPTAIKSVLWVNAESSAFVLKKKRESLMLSLFFDASEEGENGFKTCKSKMTHMF